MTVVALLVCAEVPATATDDCGPWADIDGHPLIWHAARRLREAGVTTVFLVCGPERAAAAAAITRRPDLRWLPAGRCHRFR